MQPLKFLSLFSGMEAATQAAIGTRWECAAVAEIEPAACSVLRHHYPHVPNLGNVEQITQAMVEALGHLDGVFFGSPCQDISVAGHRAGLNGERSGLFFAAMRVVRWARARYTLFENVPGLFSSNTGADFAAVVGEMVGVQPDVPDGGWPNTGVFLGPDGLAEYAVLDAQWFGVPQRRRRIFVVRDTGDWAGRSPILLEPYGLQGHSAPRRKAGKDVAPTISSRPTGGGGLGTDFDLDGGLVQAFGGNNCAGSIDTATAVNACAAASGRQDFDSETFVVQNALRGADQNGLGVSADDVMYTLDQASQHAVAIQAGALRENPDSGPDGVGVQEGIAYTLEARAEVQAVAFQSKASASQSMNPSVVTPSLDVGKADGIAVMTLALRGRDGSPTLEVREDGTANAVLTPNGGRLQGFPDGYTAVPHRGKPMADGPRYKMHGNSWAVPCVHWILARMDQSYDPA